MSTQTATATDIARLEAKIDALLARPPYPAPDTNVVLTSAEAMTMLRVTSPTSFSKLCAKLGIKKITTNRYRLGDIQNAIARATMPKRGERR